MTLTVGLFGTCGGSTWRVPFKKKYDELGIEYFDPQKDDWKPEDARIEAQHMAHDEVLLIAVTIDAYSLGSLTELGFQILDAARIDVRRDVLVYLEKDLDRGLDDPKLRDESIRTRVLAISHLREQQLDNLYLVDSLEQMLEVSLKLIQIARIRESIAGYNPHRKVEKQ